MGFDGRRLVRGTIVWIVALLGLAACSPNDPQDSPCNDTSDCQSGLDCVAPSSAAGDGGTCTSLGNKRCSKTCTGDDQCSQTNFGSCSLTACDGTRYCMGSNL